MSVDLDALAANFETLKTRAGGAQVAPAVKADGYGLGAVPVARKLWAQGARAFYVARLGEGQKLRAALPAATIYVLDGATPGACAQLVEARLTPVLGSLEQVGRWAAQGSGSAVLHIDTGMNRLGVRPEQLGQVKGVRVDLVISHLACAGAPDHPMNAAQRALFLKAATTFSDARQSLAGSGGIYLGGEYHFNQVRPGISLYGGGPRDATHPDIVPVATLLAPILQVREIAAGETVGYGAAFTADRPMRVGIVAAGYADGMMRSLNGRGQVWFEGSLRPMLGRVSMDMIAIDLGEAAAAEGDLVELIGPHILVDQAAAWAGTNAYEVLTRLGTRVEHRYLGEAAV